MSDLLSAALIVLAVLLGYSVLLRSFPVGDAFHPEAEDPFTAQARRDQRKTDYPGCWRGLMNCRSQTCGCVNESQPNERFVQARAALLRERTCERQGL